MTKLDPQPPEAPEPADRATSRHGRAGRLAARGLDELRRFLILFLYLWILFGLFVLNEHIILQEQGIRFVPQGLALLNALIMAKVMLVLEDINLSRWLHHRPLLYPILHDSFLFAILFIVFHVIEEVIVGLFRHRSAAESVPTIGGGGISGVVCVAVILFFALIPFFAFQNFSRALGSGRMRAMLFGPVGGSPAK